jgi:hypothetical protein
MGFFSDIKRIGEKVSGGVARVGSVVSHVAGDINKVGQKVAPYLEAGATALGQPEIAGAIAGGLKLSGEVSKIAGDVSKSASAVGSDLQSGNIGGAVSKVVRAVQNKGVGVGSGARGIAGATPSALGISAPSSVASASKVLGNVASGTRSTNSQAIEQNLLNYIQKAFQ